MKKFNLDNFLLPDAFAKTEYNPEKFYLPFKTSTSFVKLIEHIKKIAKEDRLESALAKSILNELKDTPELCKEIYDNSILKKHEKLIESMMMFVFPNAFYEKQTFAAASSFFSNVFYSTPKFRETIKITDNGIEGEFNIDEYSFNWGKNVSVYVTLLNTFYDFNFNFEFPIVYKSPDPVTGLDRHFKLNFANEFLDIKLRSKLKQFSAEEMKSIRENIYDFDYLRDILNPENFEFTGFLVINAINISDTEILSAIKKDLIEKNTITSTSGFLKLQYKLQSLLKCPGLMLGLADFPGSSSKLFQYGEKIGNSFILNDQCIENLKSIEGSIYDYCFQKRRAIVIEDLPKFPKKTKLEEEILKQGIKSILIAPLLNEDEIVGVLEMGSPTAGQINNINTIKLREVIPLFAMAVNRSKEEMDNKIEAVIKEECTAIHPSLEWRFKNAALDMIKKEREGIKSQMEEIIFHNVYPLYGLSDIRNSSLNRNEAIRMDLIENLKLAKNVIEIAQKYKPMHIFDDFIYRIEKKCAALNFGIDSGDESEILLYVKNYATGLFDYLKNINADVNEAVEKYFSNLDSNLGFVYRERKKYEESAAMINNTLASYIDEEQDKIQKVYPHYFERYKTDGVEHTIYIGSSLNENGNFNELYLKNIRLWQLILMCNIAVKARDVKKNLSIPLDTAHLILVQSNPLSIRFRQDEKKFDVDGVYNVRYEIMKKRIDKAEIKGKEERLTQPEKIAIVYSQNSELREYADYIEFLQSKNYLKKEVEELELEELQGVKGLKALRVSVNIDSFIYQDINNEKLLKDVEKLITN